MSGAISRAGPYTQLANDSNSGNDFRGVAGAGLRQFPECVPEPLAGGRERGEAALALPPLQPYAGLVGECATGELAGAAREMPGVRGVDWVAVSTGGSGGGWALGVASLAVHGLPEPGHFGIQSSLPFDSGVLDRMGCFSMASGRLGRSGC